MQQLHGYDFIADIWSFGITTLELSHGHAPFSKYPPMKVLLMTSQIDPPGLDHERDEIFKEPVATCLVKDPKKPSIWGFYFIFSQNILNLILTVDRGKNTS
ncbi:hypothetical protein UlMin_024501 [Ulmus minor]